MKRCLATFMAAAMVFTVLPALPVTAQEAGEPVELALPAPMGSLKTVPLMQELIDILNNPLSAPTRRQSFGGVVLPPLVIHSPALNPLTAQPMLVDPVTGEISWDIPAVGVPAIDMATGLFYNPATGLYDRALETPANETDFVVDRTAAIQLGKALFWDMQVGSDGVQSCGTCHFNNGVDNRTRNQLNPNHLGGDFTLQVKGPNQAVVASDFPFHKLLDPDLPGEPLLNSGNVTADANDVMSSMGVIFRKFLDIPTPGATAFVGSTPGNPLLPDIGSAVAADLLDPIGAVFQGLRRVEPRNTPTIHAAALNFDNFWDGRARHDFNGGSVFGAGDPFFHVYVGDDITGLSAAEDEENPGQPVRIRFSSLASQAVGPPLSNFEMSFDGRNWAKIGKKLLQPGVVPLANQLVDPTDSVLGPLSNFPNPGLNVSYVDLIQQAFGSDFWSNTTDHLAGTAVPTIGFDPVNPYAGPDPFDGYTLSIVPGVAASPANTNQFKQIEANFSLFFGLSVQVWEEILIPDDTPFDRFLDANPNQFLGLGFVPDADPGNPGVQPAPLVGGLTTRQLAGFDFFTGSNHSGQNSSFKSARCGLCHNGPELTDHSNNANHALLLPDPLTGKPSVITGVHLEEETTENAQDAVEIDNISFNLLTGLPTGHSLLDNGIYNIGVRPIDEDVSRGGPDPFGFPLSLATLAMQNVGVSEGVATPSPLNYTVTPLTAAEMVFDPVTGTFIPTGITLPAGVDIAYTPLLPGYLAPWANEFTVGEAWPMIDRTIFLPDTISATVGVGILPTGTFPNPNRIGKMGNFKAPQLRNVELTGPYFHTGSYLTLRQVVDFYGHGGDFPTTNAAHRDPHIIRLNDNTSGGGAFNDDEKDAIVDFLLSLTDERVKFAKAPFDHPEVFVPVDGTAPDNTGGRAAFLADARFLHVPEVGAAGHAGPLPNFLGVLSVQEGLNANGTRINNVLDHFDSISNAPNQAPLAVNDTARARRNRTTTINVVVNDRDPDGTINKNSVRIRTQPANGIVAVVANGKVNYTPNRNFIGPELLTYTVRDNKGSVSNVATVTLTVK
ncbi:MAG: cytochrome c peroxidase [Armatimonadota bacterium]|nr:cytochrome c peroxidase [Armatimonadota bacterium]